MLTFALLIAAVFCAVQAVRAPRLLASAIWLAGVSALIALLLYTFGAREVAVIELSVGAGLVTVLFVFAISMAGEDLTDLPSILPRWLALGLVGAALVLLVLLTLPLGEQPAAPEGTFGALLWQERGADVLVQLVLIFAGVLGVLGVLADDQHSAEAEAVAAQADDQRLAEPDEAHEAEKELA